MTEQLDRVPLDERHRELGAKMTEFNGFAMPVKYEGITEEHQAVRNRVGLFDVSHMGEIDIRGDGAVRALDSVITNDASDLDDGQAIYSSMCDESGGIVDDLVSYRLDDDRAFICVNAGNRQKDFNHIREYARGDASISNRSDEFVLLALQGPRAEAVLGPLTDADVDELRFFRSTFADVAGVETLVSRTGYTGEDGFELYIPAERGVDVFDALVESGRDEEMALCGLGARDTLRLEAMLNLYGQDMTEDNNPYEARLGWTVELDKETPFVGRDALREVADQGPERRLRGLVLEGRGVIRPGYDIYADDSRVGEVTSGTYAPTLDESIGLGYIDTNWDDIDEVEIEIRDRRVEARTTDKPFYER